MWTKPAVFLLVSLMSLSAAAFTPDLKALEDMTLVTRYPQGSLVSRESAEHALSEVKKAQSRLKEQADYAHRRCEENFFVNSCRDFRGILHLVGFDAGTHINAPGIHFR